MLRGSPVGRLVWWTADQDFPQDRKERGKLERSWLDALAATNPKWLLSFICLKGSKITHQIEYSLGYLDFWKPDK